MNESLADKWRLLLRRPGAKSEVDASHPLRFIYGSDELGRPLLFVITARKPALPELSAAVEVVRGVRAIDGRWTLSMTLVDSSYRDVFFVFANDLVTRSGGVDTEAAALQDLYIVLRQWKRLFSGAPQQGLSRQELRGLMGELWYGFVLSADTRSASEVLDAWRGPFGADQDFRFVLGDVVEVKTAWPNGTEVEIASADQLDVDDMRLRVMFLDETASPTDDSFTLSEMLGRVKVNLGTDVSALAGLEERLRRLRVGDPADYDDVHFLLAGWSEYMLSSGCPRIRRSLLDPAIDAVSYSLSLHGLAPFKLSEVVGDDMQGGRS